MFSVSAVDTGRVQFWFEVAKERVDRRGDASGQKVRN